MDTLNVVTVCGSLRKASLNAALARHLPGLAPASMSVTAAPAWDAIPLFNGDVMAQGIPGPILTLAGSIRDADGVIVVSPEYNWTIPGGLKNTLDWLSRLKDQPFKDKPMAIMSCSTGPLGGARMQPHLRQSLSSLDALHYIKPEIFVSFAATKFDEQTLDLTDQPTIDIVKKHLNGFEAFIRKSGGRRGTSG